MKTVVEIGGGIFGHLWFLSGPHVDPQKLDDDLRNRVPGGILEYTGPWENYIVEVDPTNFLKILNRVKEFESENTFLILGGLSAKSDFRLIPVYKPNVNIHNMGSLVAPAYPWFEEERPEYHYYIKTFTLDELLGWIPNLPVIVRIDIEGEERSVFETYSWAYMPHVWQVDHHNRNVDWFVKLFESKGYHIIGTHLGEDELEIWATK